MNSAAQIAIGSAGGFGVAVALAPPVMTAAVNGRYECESGKPPCKGGER